MAIRAGELRGAWAAVAGRYGGWRLTLPGDPSFICQPQTCDAYCCRAFHIAIGEGEAARLGEAVRQPPARFLESEDGEPIALPLAKPFVLGRGDAGCVFLSDALDCEQYEARPDACRSYPHQVVFVGADGRAAGPSREAGWRAVEAVAAGRAAEGPIPLLLHHAECPGFTGPPLGGEAWAALLRETYALAVGGADEVVSSRP